MCNCFQVNISQVSQVLKFLSALKSGQFHRISGGSTAYHTGESEAGWILGVIGVHSLDKEVLRFTGSTDGSPLPRQEESNIQSILGIWKKNLACIETRLLLFWSMYSSFMAIINEY